MKLQGGAHLAYCTNIHRGSNWAETLDSLKQHTLSVRDQVCRTSPYAIGLRLGDQAARELQSGDELARFREWLEQENCYVFTINGFPYGNFHGNRVKEQVYRPDWAAPERLEYTNRLFDILAELLPPGVEGSVSSLPGSFKEFVSTPEHVQAIRDNLWSCVDHMRRLSDRTGKTFHLGLEPEPLGLFETSTETLAFFEGMRADRPEDDTLGEWLGVNYDTCHLAVEYEDAREGLEAFRAAGIRISKLHLSSALKMSPTPEALKSLRAFSEDVYLHQVAARFSDGAISRWKDLEPAFQDPLAQKAEEWRVHFHVPLHCPDQGWFRSTSDHIHDTLDWLVEDPNRCSHLEMETYTWEVLPPALKKDSVVDQLVEEYRWTLEQFSRRGMGHFA